MKALVIAPQPFFTPRGTPFSVYYRMLLTAQQGVEIDLLTYGQGQDVVIPGVRLIRIPRFGIRTIKVGPSALKAFFDLFMIIWTIALLLRRRYDFVHAHEEAVFYCRFLKPLFRFKLIYDMHSSLPQQLTNFRFTTSKLLIGLFSVLERTSLRAADAVITICPDLADYVLKEGVDSKRHFLIENSIFDDVVLAGGQGTGREDQAPAALEQGGPLVVYAGTFESYQGLDILIKAFATVYGSRPDARLLLAGGAPDQVKQMQALAGEYRLDGHCLFTGWISKSQARACIERADVLVSPRRQGTNTPLKIYEQLASGNPLVATNIWSHTQVLDETVCFLVDPEPESMAAGILAALGDDARRRKIVQNALNLYESKYAGPVYERKIRQLLEVIA